MNEMGYTEHFEELRKRIIYVVVYFCLFLGVGFYFTKDVYAFLSNKVEGTLTVLGPSEIIWIFFMIATLFSVTCTIPFAALQLWIFVKPALSLREQRITLTYIPALFVLFILGILFGYFIIFPILFQFLASLGEGIVEQMFTAEKYFTFMANIVIPFGVLFEIPIVVLFLTTIGILNPILLSKIRKYAYFVLIVIGVLLSPPDFMSDFITSFPLIIIYEISIILSRFAYKKKNSLEFPHF